MEFAGLVEQRGSRVAPSDALPTVDEAWSGLATVLLIGLCRRLGSYSCEPLPGILLIAHVGNGIAPLDGVRDWWDSRCPEGWSGMLADVWSERLDTLLFHFSDSGLWSVDDDELLTLTDLGRDFTIAYLGALDSGLLAE